MARQTKAEREAQTAAEIQESFARRRREYRGKMFTAVDVAVNRLGWVLNVAPDIEELVVKVPNEKTKFLLELEMEENESWNKLERFEQEVRWALGELEEAERKVRMKNAALAKLTPEERKLLGI
jgi:hypothetical protein